MSEQDESIVVTGAGEPDRLQRLWTPHRMSYIAEAPQGSAKSNEPFSDIPKMSDEDGLVVARGESVYAVLNLYPYNPGHAMIDRSARARSASAATNQIVLIAGPMLLGRGLDVDLSVHLRLSGSALRRRTSADDQWTCAPLLEYYDGLDHAAGRPDFLVRWDHPDRPALERN